MHRITSLGSLAFALLSMSGLGLLCMFSGAPIAPAQAGCQTKATDYWFCESKTNTPPYSAAVVKTVSTGADCASISRAAIKAKQDLEESFASFLAKKYGYAGTTSCINPDDAESFRKERLGRLRALGYHPVETDWTPSLAASAIESPVAQEKSGTIGRAGSWWAVCWTQGASTRTDRGIRTTTYISGVVPVAVAYHEQDVAKAFDKYIDTKGVYPPGGHSISQCVHTSSPAEAQMVIQRTRAGTTKAPGTSSIVDCSRWNTQCVETDWTSMPPSPTADATKPLPMAVSGAPVAVAPVASKPTAPSGAPTPPSSPVASSAVNPSPRASNQPARRPGAPAPAVQEAPYAICWGQINGPNTTAYFSAPFAASARNIPAWSAAYKEFLGNQYKFSGVVHCPIQKSFAEAQQRIQQLEEQMTRSRWKIVETGWKNE